MIGKKYCGNYYYYIEASLSGKRDRNHNSGLYVKGWCEPKIVDSRWCKQPGGQDERKTYVFSYGHLVYLHLDTEGLNGDRLIVEVYKVVTGGGGLNDDKLMSTYDAKVVDGQVNLKIGNTYQWYGKIGRPKDKEEFYVKVKTASGVEITDGKDKAHARFLRIQNRVVSKGVESSTNNTPTKVDLPDKNQKNTHSCRYKEISVDDNGDHFVVFKEGSTKFKKVTSETQLVTRRIHFAFDKSEIRTDERAFLQTLLDFLLYNQHLDMTLSGHADDRGTLDYNQALSERRAQAVKDFFVNGGLVKSRIKTRGYGEVNPAVTGKTEEAYKKNRRVEIDFSYLEYNQEALIYETIGPDAKKAKEITVNVRERIDKGCFRKEKHDKNIIYINETGGKDLIPKKGDKIKQTVFSQQAAFPKNYALMLLKYLNPFSTIDYKFAFYINSCAYYASKKNATLEVRVYPDIIWIGHFQYNGEDKVIPYYFHQKNFDLEQGITDVLNELKSTIFYKIFRLFPTNFIVEHTLLKYIESQAKSYFYGIHTIHNRTVEKAGQELSLVGTQTNIIKQTDYTRFAAAAVIYGFVVVGILIELLMIYLTRGRNVVNKLQKFAKMARKAEAILKRMEDAGVELIPPAIAVNAGMYYQKQKDGKVGVVYEANLKADPLIAVNFKREFDLLDLITKKIQDIKGASLPKDPEAKKKLERNKKNNDSIASYFETSGVHEIKGTIEVRGDLIFEHNVRYSVLTNSYSISDKLGNGVATAKNEMLLKEQILFNAVVEGKYEGVFKFCKLQTSIEGKVRFTLKGSLGSKLTYGVNNKDGKGLFVAKSLYCSGVEGTYYGSLEIKGVLGVFKKETNGGEPIPFTLIEPFEMPLYQIQLFKS
ncbi:OmpA family protein [Chryseobacterium tructae]|uniref:OmpA family protein n=1 Tax=Chryseobacterium tructae TaxID=1037380 RepID=UPI0025B4054C|nr:OmpA family protein [Chryseobacterium tructae]MDN3691859.1 OmpA family protein [Chryseobacterium tructae]